MCVWKCGFIPLTCSCTGADSFRSPVPVGIEVAVVLVVALHKLSQLKDLTNQCDDLLAQSCHHVTRDGQVFPLHQCIVVLVQHVC